MPVIHLVRHGQASFGSADYDALSDLGREQGEVVGAELARRRVRDPLVFSGTLRRQRDTAALLGLGTTADQDARWNEYDHLDLVKRHRESTGTTAPSDDAKAFQAHLDAALLAWIEGGDADGWGAFAGGAIEALHAVHSRLTMSSRAAGAAGAQPRDAVVVTSGGVIAAVVGTLLGVPAAGTVALNRMMVNASISTVLVGSSGLNVLSYNDHAHFAGARARMRTYR
jgi:broad specificity phosphatase PhoE